MLNLTPRHALLLAPLLFAGCHRSPAPDVMATVNGHAILRADLDKVYTQQLGDQAPDVQPSAEQADSLRLNLLSQLISEEIVEQRAAKMSLTATDAEVDAKLAEMKAPFSEEQFDERVRQHHTTVDEIKRDLRRSLTSNKLFNKEINSRINVTDGDVQAYYNSHKSEFNNIETQYHLAKILVSTDPNGKVGNLQGSKAQSDADARKKVLALKNRVDSGEDFGALAMNFSEDPQTSPSGGDMGSIPESQLKTSPAVFTEIEKLKPGQVTDIMPFPDPQDPKKIGGYVLFQLLAREPAGQHLASEPQVQQRIRQGLRDARSQLLKAAYFEMLHDQARIENFFAEQIFKSDGK